MRGGIQYRHALTPIPSDSFPGLVGQITGGNPKTTGIYYDDTYNRSLLPPGAPCTPGQTTGLGSEVGYAENLDVESNSIDAGYGIADLYAGLPSSVLKLPGDVPTIDQKVIDPTNLPIDPATCTPVYPHQYLKVNTIFEVAHVAGLRTAWTDKHAAYEITAGPGGTGVDDCSRPRSTDPPPIRPCRPARAPTGRPPVTRTRSSTTRSRSTRSSTRSTASTTATAGRGDRAHPGAPGSLRRLHAPRPRTAADW